MQGYIFFFATQSLTNDFVLTFKIFLDVHDCNLIVMFSKEHIYNSRQDLDPCIQVNISFLKIPYSGSNPTSDVVRVLALAKNLLCILEVCRLIPQGIAILIRKKNNTLIFSREIPCQSSYSTYSNYKIFSTLKRIGALRVLF